MENVTDKISNPFGMRPPCDSAASGEYAAVFGYGDANADFHVIGDHPGVHGGRTTGVPFTESATGNGIQGVLYDLGLVRDRYADEPLVSNLFMSYLHLCATPASNPPSPSSYARFERFFDAELRAINAHILLPVGWRATDHVLEEFTTLARKIPRDMNVLHSMQIRGRGFLVVPIKEPTSWVGNDRDRLVADLDRLFASDYRQTKGVATTVG